MRGAGRDDGRPGFEAVLYVHDDQCYVAARLVRGPPSQTPGDGTSDPDMTWRALAHTAAEWNGAVGFPAASPWKVSAADGSAPLFQMQLETSPEQLDRVAVAVDSARRLGWAVEELRAFCDEFGSAAALERMTLQAEAGFLAVLDR